MSALLDLQPVNSINADSMQIPDKQVSLDIPFSQIQKHFSDSAQTYVKRAQLQQRVGQTLFNKLKLGKAATSLINRDNKGNICVDLGCGPGLFTPLLNQEFETVIALDLANDMLKVNDVAKAKVQANSHALPFLPQSVDVFYSSLMVQWCDLHQVLDQVYNALKPNGKAVIATLLDGTLFELEQAWSKVDSDKHIHEYLSVEQLTSTVQNRSWRQIQLTQQAEVFWFSNARMLAKELKSLGANFVQNRQNKGLVTKNTWQQMESAYKDAFYNPQQQGIPATYQVMYLELTK